MSQKSEEQKERERWRRVYRVYGITKEQYDKISRSPICLICRQPFVGAKKRVIDHSHRSGEVRSANICSYCNGWVLRNHEDIDTLKFIIKYLRDSHTGWIVPERKKKRKTSK